MIAGDKIDIKDTSITKSIVTGNIAIDKLPNDGPKLNDALLERELAYSKKSIELFHHKSKLLK